MQVFFWIKHQENITSKISDPLILCLLLFSKFRSYRVINCYFELGIENSDNVPSRFELSEMNPQIFNPFFAKLSNPLTSRLSKI